MKKLIILLLLPAYVFLWSCGGNHNTEKEALVAEHIHEDSEHSAHPEHATTPDHPAHAGEIEFTHEQADAAGLKTSVVQPGKFHQVIKTSGRIQPAAGDEASIVATTSGILSFSNSSITEGTAVNRGEALATITSANLAEGDPAAKARITFETAEKDYSRGQELVRDKIISARDFEQITMRYQTAKVAYEALKDNMTPSGVRVNSPIAGYVKNIAATQGAYVATGDVIAVVSQNRRLQLRAEVSQRYFGDLPRIRGANFRLSYDSRLYALDELGGRLISSGKASSGDSFYVPVTFEFNNEGGVVPGSYAEVYLLSGEIEGVISVPHSAIVEDQGLSFVYIKVHDEDYLRCEVATGRDDGRNVEITSGLQPGDEVVIEGAYQLRLASVSSVIPEGHSHSH